MMAAVLFSPRDNNTEVDSGGLVGLAIPQSDQDCRDSYNVICAKRSDDLSFMPLQSHVTQASSCACTDCCALVD